VRRSELEWSRGRFGAAQVFPEAYEAFVNYLPEEDRAKPNEAYYKLLTCDDPAVRIAAAREWNRWDLSIGELRPDLKDMKLLEDDDWVLSHAKMEAHYFMHGAWLEEGQILKEENLDRIRHIPSKYIEHYCHCDNELTRPHSDYRPGPLRHGVRSADGLGLAQGIASFALVLDT
jgi:proline iminopeptidase